MPSRADPITFSNGFTEECVLRGNMGDMILVFLLCGHLSGCFQLSMHIVFAISPRFELPLVKDENIDKKLNITCHSCGQPGHKASTCPQNPQKENFKV